jgi:hypothetical protein
MQESYVSVEEHRIQNLNQKYLNRRDLTRLPRTLAVHTPSPRRPSPIYARGTPAHPKPRCKQRK